MYSDLLFDYLKNIEIESGKDIKFSDTLKISSDSYEILNEKESKEYGKPIGKYELIGISDVLYFSKNEISKCIRVVADIFRSIIGDIKSTDKILVVGLGNRHISSDSLGAKVVAGINITIENKALPKVMAICPSVMGLTGIETVEIVEGVSEKVKPTHLILIDSLCASSIDRLGKSIQITNTGICPGGGIGNKRKCIGENIAKNVYSIGVPLLIYASTFIKETMHKYGVDMDYLNSIMQKCKKSININDFSEVIRGIKQVLSDNLDQTIVSIKDIEECVMVLSKIISSALNIVLKVDGY